MAKVKNQTQFSKGDKYKRIPCLNCKGFLMESHISHKITKEVICKRCGALSGPISPPYVGEFRDKLGVFFGPKDDSTFTAVPEHILEDLFKDQIKW